jgi:hypothetical protein
LVVNGAWRLPLLQPERLLFPLYAIVEVGLDGKTPAMATFLHFLAPISSAAAPYKHYSCACQSLRQQLLMQVPSPSFLQHLLEYRLCRETSTIDYQGVLSRHQRRLRAASITRIALLDGPEKARESNTFTIALQLVKAPFRAGFSACREEYLQGRAGKHNRTHIAAVRDQSRRLLEASLTFQQGCANSSHGRDPRGGGTALISANLIADINVTKTNFSQPVGRWTKAKVQARSELRNGILIIKGYTAFKRGVRRHPIQCTTIEHVPAQRLSQLIAKGAFASAAGAVNCDDR